MEIKRYGFKLDGKTGADGNGLHLLAQERAARISYQMADAMLAAREQK